MSYWDLIEPAWDSISIHTHPEVFLKQYMAESEAPRMLFAAYWCQTEVCNGGFDQFFYNSTGVLAPEAIEAFREIGMPKIAALSEQAVSILGPSYPRDRDERRQAMARRDDAPDPFELLDNMFSDLIIAENEGFEAAADTYASSHT